MSKLLFRLNGVPEDEADDVRQLLDEGGFEFYETSAGFFGLGAAAIWTHDTGRLEAAKKAIDDYQAQRAIVMRARYEQRVADGEELTFWQHVLQHPFKWLGVLVIVGFVLAVTMLPFWKTLHP